MTLFHRVLVVNDRPELPLGEGVAGNPTAFEIDRFRLDGTASPGPTPGELTLTGKPHEERRAHPLAISVSDYSR